MRVGVFVYVCSNTFVRVCVCPCVCVCWSISTQLESSASIEHGPKRFEKGTPRFACHAAVSFLLLLLLPLLLLLLILLLSLLLLPHFIIITSKAVRSMTAAAAVDFVMSCTAAAVDFVVSCTAAAIGCWGLPHAPTRNHSHANDC